MPAPLVLIVLLAYASLALELAVFPVPSVASSLRIWSPGALRHAYSPQYRRLFELRRPLRLMIIVPPLLVLYSLYAYPLATVWLGSDLLGDYVFAPRPATNAAGAALVVIGRAVTFTSVLAMRRPNPESGGASGLHTSGPFRWSRNPGLVGSYLFVSGIWLTMPSAGLAAAIVFYVAYMDFKVRMEEDFLRNRFGAAYDEYAARTGRYLT